MMNSDALVYLRNCMPKNFVNLQLAIRLVQLVLRFLQLALRFLQVRVVDERCCAGPLRLWH